MCLVYFHSNDAAAAENSGKRLSLLFLDLAHLVIPSGLIARTASTNKFGFGFSSSASGNMRLMVLKQSQPWNTFEPIFVREGGMVIVVKDEHWEKAQSSIHVTAGGMVIVVKDLHPKKAPYPIDVTEDGMVIVDG